MVDQDLKILFNISLDWNNQFLQLQESLITGYIEWQPTDWASWDEEAQDTSCRQGATREEKKLLLTNSFCALIVPTMLYVCLPAKKEPLLDYNSFR